MQAHGGERLGDHLSTSQEIRLAELLAAISLATDLGRGFPQEKALRTCLVAERIAEELGLDERACSDAYHAALIHPVGCTAFTYEDARRFGTSELTGLPAFIQADAARPREAIRAIRESVQGEPVGRRVRARSRTSRRATNSGPTPCARTARRARASPGASAWATRSRGSCGRSKSAGMARDGPPGWAARRSRSARA
jgi:hypothetical protein